MSSLTVSNHAVPNYSSVDTEEIYLSAKYQPAHKKYTVASFDGGGVRGIIPITFMKHICQLVGEEPHNIFDLMVGTSTGGLIAISYIGHRNENKEPLFKASELPEFWKSKMIKVFPRRYFSFIPKFDGLFCNRYSSKGLRKVLYGIADDSMTLQSNTLSDCILTTYDYTNNTPVYLKSTTNNPVNSLIEALQCTTAAPTYLPAFRKKIDGKERIFLDGGLVNNNPSEVGYMYAQNLAGNRPIEVFSFGTGAVKNGKPYKRIATAGMITYLPSALNILFNAMVLSPDQILKDCLRERYFRLQINNIDPNRAELDDTSDVPYLEEKALEMIKDNPDLFERVTSAVKPKFDPLDPYAKPVEYYS